MYLHRRTEFNMGITALQFEHSVRMHLCGQILVHAVSGLAPVVTHVNRIGWVHALKHGQSHACRTPF
jgi:hypothetical protein